MIWSKPVVIAQKVQHSSIVDEHQQYKAPYLADHYEIEQNHMRSEPKKCKCYRIEIKNLYNSFTLIATLPFSVESSANYDGFFPNQLGVLRFRCTTKFNSFKFLKLLLKIIKNIQMTNVDNNFFTKNGYCTHL